MTYRLVQLARLPNNFVTSILPHSQSETLRSSTTVHFYPRFMAPIRTDAENLPADAVVDLVFGILTTLIGSSTLVFTVINCWTWRKNVSSPHEARYDSVSPANDSTLPSARRQQTHEMSSFTRDLEQGPGYLSEVNASQSWWKTHLLSSFGPECLIVIKGIDQDLARRSFPRALTTPDNLELTQHWQRSHGQLDIRQRSTVPLAWPTRTADLA